MTLPLRRVVFDCNIFLQAVSNRLGPSGECVRKALEARVQLYTDETILAEVREVAARPNVQRKLRLMSERVDELISDIRKVAILIQDAPCVFYYPRDPDDAHYIDVAAAADAELVVSRDRDLLDLMGSGADADAFKQQFPRLRILDPASFLRESRTRQGEMENQSPPAS